MIWLVSLVKGIKELVYSNAFAVRLNPFWAKWNGISFVPFPIARSTTVNLLYSVEQSNYCFIITIHKSDLFLSVQS